MSHQSLLVTRRKSSSIGQTNLKHTKTYQLLLNQPALQLSTLTNHDHPQNIFRQNVPLFVGQETNERPIGGIKLLKKMTMNREVKHRKGSKNKNKIETKDANIKNKEKRVLTQIKEVKTKTQHFRVHSSIEPRQQILKEHKIFSKNKEESLFKSLTTRRVYQSTLSQATQKQRKEYLDKTALLGQISYNRSLIQHIGDQYFQYIVRDRWKEQFKQAKYIYQIKKQEPFTNSKPILLIKKHHPHLKERRKLILQGKAIVKQFIDSY